MKLRLVALALLWVPTNALAVDLDELLEAWTITVDGQDGNDGVDEARDVALTSGDEIVVVGFLDGKTGHDKDGYILNLALDGTTNWERFIDTGAVGGDILGSNDRVEAVHFDDDTDQLAWCGSQGGDAKLRVDPDVQTWAWLENTDPLKAGSKAPPGTTWERYIRDSNGLISPEQSCFDTRRGGGEIHAVGWSVFDTNDEAGSWQDWRYNDVQNLPRAPIRVDSGQFLAAPDQAYGIAYDDVSDEFALVGAFGVSGLAGEDATHNFDWHVRYLDPAVSVVTPMWLETRGGTLDDRALAAVYRDDVSGDQVIVAGYENQGSDNTTNSDRDWLVVAYDILGDGSGFAAVDWVHRHGVASGADEVATAVAIDDNGDILVAGSGRDATSGNEVWRLSKLTQYDGVALQTWTGPDHGGDSRITGMEFRDGRIVMVGYIDDGTGRDFAMAMLEGDRDDDGTADSVDACPDNDEKWKDEGVCGCQERDLDTDGDGVENCIEECPTDPNKQDPGVCGCERPDDDTDSDGTLDCNDRCPEDPDKTELGDCGCGAADTDEDGDGVVICRDACPDTPAGDSVNEFGCEPMETTDTGGDGTDGPGVSDGNCSCDASGPAGVALVPLLGLLALVRRRD
ncbi:MAG: hypothetical protein KTR31_36895 [Myxococcales bacterium]|nr:hypothetical protein [Myxococcales bacterium]